MATALKIKMNFKKLYVIDIYFKEAICNVFAVCVFVSVMFSNILKSSHPNYNEISTKGEVGCAKIP